MGPALSLSTHQARSIPMFIESKSGNEGRAATVSPFTSGNQAIGSIQAPTDTLKYGDGACLALLRAAARGAVAFFAGRNAKGGSPAVDAPAVAGAPSRVHTGGMGLLSLAALTFSTAQDAHSADGNVTSLDD